MTIWLDFLQVALALGIGWLGWVLLMLTRPLAGPSVAPGRRRGAAYGGPTARAGTKKVISAD